MPTPTEEGGVRRRHSSQYDIDISSTTEVAAVESGRSRSMDEGISTGDQRSAASMSSAMESPKPARTGSRSGAAPKVRFSMDFPLDRPSAAALAGTIEGRVTNETAETSSSKESKP